MMIRVPKLMLLVGLLIVPIAVGVTLPSCRSDSAAGVAHPRVIVIGFDGFDPRLCSRMMDAGELPNLAKLRDQGGYKPLGTSTPPQSPVAWATFITGGDPGNHGIFDFVHRNPAEQLDKPYYSASQIVESMDGWEIGDHRIPLTFFPFNDQATEPVLMREGTPFWDYLDAKGVPSAFYDLPANYPPSQSRYGHMCCLCGMGTPDLLGSYGTYQFFSARQRESTTESGGMRHPLRFKKNVATATLEGPVNSLLQEPKPTEVELEIYRHPTEAVARIELQDNTIVLEEGEWSDWVQVDFAIGMPPFLPDDSVSGICRFYLQRVRPDFRLYVSPINMDPTDPALTLSEPPEFVGDIADDLGLFYTAGFQEDYNALTNGVFTDEDYHTQANHVLEERLELLDYALNEYEDGLLFFYFSSTDLQAHMFWWDSDAPHPVRDPENARKYMGVIKDLYRRMDGVMGDIIARHGDDTTILLMSDHGFANFRRQFNLNTWLRENGYVYPEDCTSVNVTGNVDWSRTKAYGLGINGLYINLAGRERDGCVDPAEKDALLEELREKLLAVRDPETGEQVISKVYRADEVYTGQYTALAPDLIVGYARGYRSSWGTVTGDISEQIFSDNDKAWSADHCMATDEVPGVIFSNRPIEHHDPSLVDVAPTILELFGVSIPEHMMGTSLFAPPKVAQAD